MSLTRAYVYKGARLTQPYIYSLWISDTVAPTVFHFTAVIPVVARSATIMPLKRFAEVQHVKRSESVLPVPRSATIRRIWR